MPGFGKPQGYRKALKSRNLVRPVAASRPNTSEAGTKQEEDLNAET
jgi:hypothetical protein